MTDFNTEIIDDNWYCISREKHMKILRKQIRDNLRNLRRAMKHPLKRTDLFPPENYDDHYFEDLEKMA